MSSPSLANAIVKRPWLKKWMQPLANWYVDAAGYRKLGLRYDYIIQGDCSREDQETDAKSGHRADDLISEENDLVQKALKRLPPKEAYDRVFRMRRAFQVCCRLSMVSLSRRILIFTSSVHSHTSFFRKKSRLSQKMYAIKFPDQDDMY